LSENEHGFYVFQKSNNETVEIGWKLPKAKNIICCICKDQGRLTCCGSLELLARHVLSSHPEVIAIG